MSGDELARHYDLVIFPGHEEYVTEHELDVITRYRNLGGNLAFLAANNMFWDVRIDPPLMTKVGLWRDKGRPEGALTGGGFALTQFNTVKPALHNPPVITQEDQPPVAAPAVLPPELRVDVLIDFSTPEGTMAVLPLCLERKVSRPATRR